MNNQRVCIRIRTRGLRGLPFDRMLPSVFLSNERRAGHGGSRRKAAYAEGYVGGAKEAD